MHIWKANDAIVELLRERGVLLAHAKIEHSYPHCWRHKTPVIYRATPQWFIGMEQAGLRATALTSIKDVRWVPGWGEERIAGMVAGRPDWCISRQRTWGVPIALFVHKATHEPHPDSVGLLEQVAKRVEQGGIDAWFELDAAELLGDQADDYEKVTDVLDVWFDSGVTHFAVIGQRPELQQGDASAYKVMYLEGSDQHRGWFQSSLLTSSAIHGRAPYDDVLTHGFTVDAYGRKMSKSLGNVVAPQKVMDTLGADVLRLWVASADYRNEMTVSDEILKRVSDSYRRIRNTARFLLGNLDGFDPAKHLLPVEDSLALDQWAVQQAYDVQQAVVAAYERYDFPEVIARVQNFCTNELGALYLDITKDRLYTMPTDSRGRRSAQSAMYRIAEAMVRWLAPVLSFTAEEIWQALPGERGESVLFETWYDGLAAHPGIAGAAPLLGRPAGDARDRLARARRHAQGRADRRRAGGEADRACRRGAAGALRAGGGRAALLLHHLRGRAGAVGAACRRRGEGGAGRRRDVGVGQRQRGGQVRALLASSRRCRAARRASRAVRSLRQQCGRSGRGSPLVLIVRRLVRVARRVIARCDCPSALIRLASASRLHGAGRGVTQASLHDAKPNALPWLLLSVAVIGLDQLSKWWALHALCSRPACRMR